MAAVELTTRNFADVVGSASLVLLDFWGPRCGSCRAFAPIFAESAGRHPDAVFGTVDTAEHAQLAAMFRVMALPTLVVLREGYVIYARSGFLERHELEDLVAQARELDIDAVRAKRAARERSARREHSARRRN